MTLEDLCKQALELDEKVTKDWHATACQHGGQVLHRGLDKRGGHPQPHLQIVPTDDASLIAFYRSFAPAAARALLVAKKALERVNPDWTPAKSESDGKVCCDISNGDVRALQSALATIQAEMEGVK